jgi:hypothetical protein
VLTRHLTSKPFDIYAALKGSSFEFFVTLEVHHHSSSPLKVSVKNTKPHAPFSNLPNVFAGADCGLLEPPQLPGPDFVSRFDHSPTRLLTKLGARYKPLLHL